MNRFLDRLYRLRWRRNRLRFLPVCVLMVLFIAPRAKAGVADIISLLQTITSTLQNSIGSVLAQINTVENAVNNFHQQVIYPVNLINAAKTFVQIVEGRYRGILFEIRTLPLNSATLATPAQFEAAVRSASASNVTTLQAKYAQVYLQVPPPNAASPQQRDLIDMDDASATASLKTAVLADQASSRMLTLADTLANESGNSAPGSAPMLALQAQVVNLENQAYLAKMLAADLRTEATKLAHSNAGLKQSAANTRSLWLQMQQLAPHP